MAVYLCESDNCIETFTSAKAAKKHFTDNHKDHKIKCSACPRSFSRRKGLRNHLESDHGMPIIKPVIEWCKDDEEFQRKRERLEIGGVFKFRVSSTKPTSGVTYYLCHRDGFFDPVPIPEKDPRKRKPTSKINASCPCELTSKWCTSPEGDKKIRMTYHEAHHGHEMNPSFCRLPAKQMEYLEQEVARGMAKDAILDNINLRPKENVVLKAKAPKILSNMFYNKRCKGK